MLKTGPSLFNVFVLIVFISKYGQCTTFPDEPQLVSLEEERNRITYFEYVLLDTKVPESWDELPDKRDHVISKGLNFDSHFNEMKACTVRLHIDLLRYSVKDVVLCLFKDHWEEEIVEEMRVDINGESYDSNSLLGKVNPVTGYALKQEASLVTGFIIEQVFYGQVRLLDRFRNHFIIYYVEPLDNAHFYDSLITSANVKSNAVSSDTGANAILFEYVAHTETSPRPRPKKTTTTTSTTTSTTSNPNTAIPLLILSTTVTSTTSLPPIIQSSTVLAVSHLHSSSVTPTTSTSTTTVPSVIHSSIITFPPDWVHSTTATPNWLHSSPQTTPSEPSTYDTHYMSTTQKRHHYRSSTLKANFKFMHMTTEKYKFRQTTVTPRATASVIHHTIATSTRRPVLQSSTSWTTPTTTLEPSKGVIYSTLIPYHSSTVTVTKPEVTTTTASSTTAPTTERVVYQSSTVTSTEATTTFTTKPVYHSTTVLTTLKPTAPPFEKSSTMHPKTPTTSTTTERAPPIQSTTVVSSPTTRKLFAKFTTVTSTTTLPTTTTTPSTTTTTPSTTTTTPSTTQHSTTEPSVSSTSSSSSSTNTSTSSTLNGVASPATPGKTTDVVGSSGPTTSSTGASGSNNPSSSVTSAASEANTGTGSSTGSGKSPSDIVTKSLPPNAHADKSHGHDNSASRFGGAHGIASTKLPFIPEQIDSLSLYREPPRVYPEPEPFAGPPPYEQNQSPYQQPLPPPYQQPLPPPFQQPLQPPGFPMLQPQYNGIQSYPNPPQMMYPNQQNPYYGMMPPQQRQPNPYYPYYPYNQPPPPLQMMDSPYPGIRYGGEMSPPDQHPKPIRSSGKSPTMLNLDNSLTNNMPIKLNIFKIQLGDKGKKKSHRLPSSKAADAEEKDLSGLSSHHPHHPTEYTSISTESSTTSMSSNSTKAWFHSTIIGNYSTEPEITTTTSTTTTSTTTEQTTTPELVYSSTVTPVPTTSKSVLQSSTIHRKATSTKSILLRSTTYPRKTELTKKPHVHSTTYTPSKKSRPTVLQSTTPKPKSVSLKNLILMSTTVKAIKSATIKTVIHSSTAKPSKMTPKHVLQSTTPKVVRPTVKSVIQSSTIRSTPSKPPPIMKSTQMKPIVTKRPTAEPFAQSTTSKALKKSLPPIFKSTPPPKKVLPALKPVIQSTVKPKLASAAAAARAVIQSSTVKPKKSTLPPILKSTQVKPVVTKPPTAKPFVHSTTSKPPAPTAKKVTTIPPVIKSTVESKKKTTPLIGMVHYSTKKPRTAAVARAVIQSSTMKSTVAPKTTEPPLFKSTPNKPVVTKPRTAKSFVHSTTSKPPAPTAKKVITIPSVIKSTVETKRPKTTPHIKGIIHSTTRKSTPSTSLPLYKSTKGKGLPPRMELKSTPSSFKKPPTTNFWSTKKPPMPGFWKIPAPVVLGTQAPPTEEPKLFRSTPIKSLGGVTPVDDRLKFTRVPSVATAAPGGKGKMMSGHFVSTQPPPVKGRKKRFIKGGNVFTSDASEQQSDQVSRDTIPCFETPLELECNGRGRQEDNIERGDPTTNIGLVSFLSLKNLTNQTQVKTSGEGRRLKRELSARTPISQQRLSRVHFSEVADIDEEDIVEEIFYPKGPKTGPIEVYDYMREDALLCKLCIWLQPKFAEIFGFHTGAEYTVGEVIDMVRYINWVFRPMDFNMDYRPENVGFGVGHVLVSDIPEIDAIPDVEWTETEGQTKATYTIQEALNDKFPSKCCVVLAYVFKSILPFGSLAIRRGMCVENKNIAVITGNFHGHKIAKYDVYRSTVHALGHLMGALNDDEADADCRDENPFPFLNPFIMHPVHQLNVGLRPNSMRISFCSRVKIAVFMASSYTSCLESREGTFCGNGIVEPGEECDCGSPWQCTFAHQCCGMRDSFSPCKVIDKEPGEQCLGPSVMEEG